MYGIREPTTAPSGTNLTAVTILDVHHPNPKNASDKETRGARVTIPQNYYDGGSNETNGPNEPRPSYPPLPGARSLSPRPDGNGWMVWGDSYFNTGMTVPGGFMAIASVCKGKCWYATSTLHSDSRQFELHYWPSAALDATGANPWREPATMTELVVPAGRQFGPVNGNGLSCNLEAAFVTNGKMYAVGWALGPDGYTNRVFVWTLN
jgi:hypothetical protein